MIDTYHKNFIHNWLKAKSYGFKQLLIVDSNDVFFASKFRSKITLNNSKIIQSDLDCMGKLIIIDFLKNRSIQSWYELINWLDFFEFEDENDRSDIKLLVSKMHEFYDNGKLSLVFEQYAETYDNTTKNYLYSIFDKENLIVNKKFPSSLIKSPFIEFRDTENWFWPYFEVESLRIDLEEFSELIKNFTKEKAFEEINEGVLRYFVQSVSFALKVSDLDLRLYYGKSYIWII